jgi:hypothetical protein
LKSFLFPLTCRSEKRSLETQPSTLDARLLRLTFGSVPGILAQFQPTVRFSFRRTGLDDFFSGLSPSSGVKPGGIRMTDKKRNKNKSFRKTSRATTATRAVAKSRHAREVRDAWEKVDEDLEDEEFGTWADDTFDLANRTNIPIEELAGKFDRTQRKDKTERRTPTDETSWEKVYEYINDPEIGSWTREVFTWANKTNIPIAELARKFGCEQREKKTPSDKTS